VTPHTGKMGVALPSSSHGDFTTVIESVVFYLYMQPWPGWLQVVTQAVALSMQCCKAHVHSSYG